jgi:hypothetical protein
LRAGCKNDDKNAESHVASRAPSQREKNGEYHCEGSLSPGMRFASLLDLPYNAITGLIELPAITEAVANTPEPVAAQFFVDHGRDREFQALYGDLELESVK